MEFSCAFCGKWIKSVVVITDLNNNHYCEECARSGKNKSMLAKAMRTNDPKQEILKLEEEAGI